MGVIAEVPICPRFVLIAVPDSYVHQRSTIFSVEPFFYIAHIAGIDERLLPKDRVLPYYDFFSIARRPRELRREEGESSFAQGKYRGAFLQFCGPFKTSLPVSCKIFLLEDLLAPGSFACDHFLEDFASHSKILGGHVSYLKAPFHFWTGDLVPAH